MSGLKIKLLWKSYVSITQLTQTPEHVNLTHITRNPVNFNVICIPLEGQAN